MKHKPVTQPCTACSASPAADSAAQPAGAAFSGAANGAALHGIASSPAALDAEQPGQPAEEPASAAGAATSSTPAVAMDVDRPPPPGSAGAAAAGRSADGNVQHLGMLQCAAAGPGAALRQTAPRPAAGVTQMPATTHPGVIDLCCESDDGGEQGTAKSEEVWQALPASGAAQPPPSDWGNSAGDGGGIPGL